MLLLLSAAITTATTTTTTTTTPTTTILLLLPLLLRLLRLLLPQAPELCAFELLRLPYIAGVGRVRQHRRQTKEAAHGTLTTQHAGLRTATHEFAELAHTPRPEDMFLYTFQRTVFRSRDLSHSLTLPTVCSTAYRYPHLGVTLLSVCSVRDSFGP